MMELYAANTPNGHRAAVVLEELGLTYQLHKVDVFKGEAKSPAILKLNPEARVPILVDPEGPDGTPIVLTQSWAICVYLGDKHRKFMPAGAVARLRVIECLFHLGTDVMMAHSTLNAVSNFVPEKVASTIAFYEARVADVLRTLDRRLSKSEYLAGDISVADFAFYPVYRFRRALIERLEGCTHLRRWGAMLDARPACQRAIAAFA